MENAKKHLIKTPKLVKNIKQRGRIAMPNYAIIALQFTLNVIFLIFHEVRIYCMNHVIKLILRVSGDVDNAWCLMKAIKFKYSKRSFMMNPIKWCKKLLSRISLNSK